MLMREKNISTTGIGGTQINDFIFFSFLIKQNNDVIVKVARFPCKTQNVRQQERNEHCYFIISMNHHRE